MCSNESSMSPKEPGTNVRTTPPAASTSTQLPSTPSTMEDVSRLNTDLFPLNHYRLQLYNYAMAERLRCGPSGLGGFPLCPPYANNYGPRLALQMSLFHNRVLQSEEPKPQHSYIGLIAMAILSNPEKKLVLSDIYQHILDNYPYFRSRGPGWRNSIRHNLSLNDCFVKAGRSANGKGHYWAIHPANVEDFKKGDFRRRKAQRKVRKHMGLAVEEDGTDSPSPPPLSLTPPHPLVLPPSLNFTDRAAILGGHPSLVFPNAWHSSTNNFYTQSSSRKRQFDVASLLAPEDQKYEHSASSKRLVDLYQHQSSGPQFTNNQNQIDNHPRKITTANNPTDSDLDDEDIDVVANDDHSSWPTINLTGTALSRYYDIINQTSSALSNDNNSEKVNSE